MSCCQVVLLDLEVLAEISCRSCRGSAWRSKVDHTLARGSATHPHLTQHGLNVYFMRFMVNLLKLFSTDRQLMEDRGSFHHQVSLTRSLAGSLTHTHSLTHSLTHSFTHSLTHSFTHSFTHSLSHG